MKIRMLPMKGKGWETTAKNIAKTEEEDVARPLTTDPWDNAILIEYEEQET
jgi:hypothetical protein